MSHNYLITPYDPALWKDENKQIDAEMQSDLKIMISEFMNSLQDRWPGAKVSPPFSWYIVEDGRITVSGGFFGYQQQILSLEKSKGLSEFVIWYRSYISPTYPLFLFREGAWESLQLNDETTLEDVSQFTGL